MKTIWRIKRQGGISCCFGESFCLPMTTFFKDDLSVNDSMFHHVVIFNSFPTPKRKQNWSDQLVWCLPTKSEIVFGIFLTCTQSLHYQWSIHTSGEALKRTLGLHVWINQPGGNMSFSVMVKERGIFFSSIDSVNDILALAFGHSSSASKFNRWKSSIWQTSPSIQVQHQVSLCKLKK